MYTGKITIKETGEADLVNIMNLWNNGETMKYVGFPDGLGYNEEEIMNWYKRNKETKSFIHFSIYTEEYGYCGETGYGTNNNEDENLSLDIKLIQKVQGKGIAEYSLRFTIEQIIKAGIGKKVWVDPNKENGKAIKLYTKLGFKEKAFPKYLEGDEDDGQHIYMELLLKE